MARRWEGRDGVETEGRDAPLRGCRDADCAAARHAPARTAVATVRVASVRAGAHESGINAGKRENSKSKRCVCNVTHAGRDPQLSTKHTGSAAQSRAATHEREPPAALMFGVRTLKPRGGKGQGTCSQCARAGHHVSGRRTSSAQSRCTADETAPSLAGWPTVWLRRHDGARGCLRDRRRLFGGRSDAAGLHLERT